MLQHNAHCFLLVNTCEGSPSVDVANLQAPVFDEDDGGSPANKKGSRSARREGRVKGKQGGADGEPGAAIPGATLRMSEWPPNDQEVWVSSKP